MRLPCLTRCPVVPTDVAHEQTKMTYYDTQTPLTDFRDDDDSPISEANQLRELTLLFMRRCEAQRTMIHTAYELSDKLDALTDLMTTTAALAALAVACNISSQRVYEATRRLVIRK